MEKCIRTCIACRKKANKSELIRIVAKDNSAVIDKSQKENSRGIYICGSKECIKKLLKMKNMSKVIKNNVQAESLRKLLIEMEDM